MVAHLVVEMGKMKADKMVAWKGKKLADEKVALKAYLKDSSMAAE
jgi:hypothetical protein